MTTQERVRLATNRLMHIGPFGPDGSHDPELCLSCLIERDIAEQIDQAVAEALVKNAAKDMEFIV